MKKLLLTVVMALSMIFAFNMQTSAQGAVLFQAGYSWSEGVLAAGYQYGGLSTTLGYMPAKMPGSGDPVSGVVWNLKWGPEWDRSGYYLSYALNTVGYRSEISYNGGAWGSDVVQAMNIISLGYKAGNEVFYLAADLGYGWSASGSGMSWGIVFGVPIGGN